MANIIILSCLVICSNLAFLQTTSAINPTSRYAGCPAVPRSLMKCSTPGKVSCGVFSKCPAGQQCCPSSCQGKECVQITAAVPETTGKCPAATLDIVSTCDQDTRLVCQEDSECETTQKCCENGCNSVCMEVKSGEQQLSPLDELTKDRQSYSPMKKLKPFGLPKTSSAHPGKCPAATLDIVSKCEQDTRLVCQDDSECEQTQKCCDNGCNPVCMDLKGRRSTFKVSDFTGDVLTKETPSRPSRKMKSFILPEATANLGKCPAATLDVVSKCDTDTRTVCQTDGDCDVSQKCCDNGCNSVCMDVNGEQRRMGGGHSLFDDEEYTKDIRWK